MRTSDSRRRASAEGGNREDVLMPISRFADQWEFERWQKPTRRRQSGLQPPPNVPEPSRVSLTLQISERTFPLRFRLGGSSGRSRSSRLSVARRVRETDVDLPGGSITIYDPKGARTQPRVHMLTLKLDA